MEQGTLLKTINKEIEDYKNKQIQIIPGLPFNQHDTLEQIIFYYNSKFKTGEVDDEGDRKYFYNIVKNPCKVFSKAIDFDTKNIRLLTTGGGDTLKTWYLERDLKYWMRDKQFGKTLNRIFKELPIFGTVVLKIVDGTPHFVDLRNFVVEQSRDNLDEMNYITEIHNFTPASFRKAAKVMKWEQDKVDEVIEKFHQMKDTSHIRVYERYGEVAKETPEGKKSWPFMRIFIADVGTDEYDNYGRLTVQKPGVLLKEEEWEGHPYWEFHAEKVPGRWLGVGVVETLFEPQIRINELTNLQAKSSYWMALHVFQTRDQGYNRNLKGDVKNGEVLSNDSEVTEIAISDRNLAHFNSEDTRWLRNRDEQTFSFDVVQGERLPAGTPLGSAQIAQTQTLSYFEQIQENVALDVKELLYTVIIPKFLSEATAEHTLRLVGQDLDQFVELCKHELVFKETVRLALESFNGKPFPTAEDKDAITVGVEEAIKLGKEKLLTIPKNFYKDTKFDVDIDITGESVDTRVKAATKFAILQAVTADPDMLVNEDKRKLLASYAEDGGLNPNDFFAAKTKKLEEMMPQVQGRAGGGVSAPAMAGPSLPGQSSQTI